MLTDQSFGGHTPLHNFLVVFNSSISLDRGIENAGRPVAKEIVAFIQLPLKSVYPKGITSSLVQNGQRYSTLSRFRNMNCLRTRNPMINLIWASWLFFVRPAENHSSLGSNREFFHMKVKGSQQSSSSIVSRSSRIARNKSKSSIMVDPSIKFYMENPERWRAQRLFNISINLTENNAADIDGKEM